MLDALGFGWGHGMLLCTGSSVLSATGLVCQRYAFLCHAGVKGKNNVLKPWIIWAIGTAFLALSTVPDVLSYFAASNVMLAVLACLQPVFVSLMAYFMLQEAFTLNEVLGSCLCIIGAMVVVIFAPKETLANTNVLQTLPWEDTRCRWYLTLMFALVASLLVILLQMMTRPSERDGTDSRLKSFALPFLFAAVATLGKLWNIQLAIAFSDAHLSGGPWSMRWTLVGTAALMALSGVLSFLVVQGAMSDTAVDSHVFIPSCFAFGVALNFIQAVVLKEFWELPYWRMGISAIGAAVAVIGVFIMQLQPKKEEVNLKLCIDTNEGKLLRTKGHRCVQRPSASCTNFMPPHGALASIDEQSVPTYGSV
eukprot:gnl/MRDRNA2_/MRDRNA2_146078_c0_seq1.p1 gnl/MRDRNA2_/MRDRNA2_146078_c0~~gnl/MRDRNA2_/MRDRNA2_146078_c0_seq1.p1  ORF type:complete len:365 (+),score=61.48 gnl/MRDRNA2_/MRDRNA2_146078_c0_seq1:193-1287(+)